MQVHPSQTVQSEFSTERVAELSGLSKAQIHNMVRRKLVPRRTTERGHFRFSFKDLVVFRDVKRLLDSDVSMRAILEQLARLRRQLPEGESLSGTKLHVVGEKLVVQDGKEIWEVDSGQIVLNFDTRFGYAAIPLRVDSSRSFYMDKSLSEYDSEDWYNYALELEDSDLDQAIEAYERAIDLDANNVDAYINLGRLYQLNADFKRAKNHYDAALEIMPDHEVANFNMGTLWDELDEAEQALEHYRLAPSVADAHYCLSSIYAKRGDRFNCYKHYRRFEELQNPSAPA